MELTNNTILITGGTGGLGLEFAEQLLALGNTIIITGRDQSKLDLIKNKHPQINIFNSDVSDVEAIDHLYDTVIEHFPTLNILINNAGEMRKISLLDASINLYDITSEVEINLMGPIRMIQKFLPHLNQVKNPAIVNVTSGLALVPFPVAPIYGATKSGLHSYTKSLRVQLKNTTIQVFELLAPAAKTPLNDKFAGMEGFDPKSMMEPDKLVASAILGMQKNKLEIYPGLARLILIMSRLAPGLMFKQLSKVGANSFAS